MNFNDEKNVSLNWFNPFYKWNFLEPNETEQKNIEESLAITHEAYILNFLFSHLQEIDIETKIDGSFLILKFYRKRISLLMDSKGKTNTYQLLYCKRMDILPDMLPDKIKTNFKDDLAVIEIPRDYNNAINRTKSYTFNLFKECYCG